MIEALTRALSGLIIINLITLGFVWSLKETKKQAIHRFIFVNIVSVILIMLYTYFS